MTHSRAARVTIDGETRWIRTPAGVEDVEKAAGVPVSSFTFRIWTSSDAIELAASGSVGYGAKLNIPEGCRAEITTQREEIECRA